MKVFCSDIYLAQKRPIECARRRSGYIRRICAAVVSLLAKGKIFCGCSSPAASAIVIFMYLIETLSMRKHTQSDDFADIDIHHAFTATSFRMERMANAIMSTRNTRFPAQGVMPTRLLTRKLGMVSSWDMKKIRWKWYSGWDDGALLWRIVEFNELMFCGIESRICSKAATTIHISLSFLLK